MVILPNAPHENLRAMVEPLIETSMKIESSLPVTLNFGVWD